MDFPKLLTITDTAEDWANGRQERNLRDDGGLCQTCAITQAVRRTLNLPYGAVETNVLPDAVRIYRTDHGYRFIPLAVYVPASEADKEQFDRLTSQFDAGREFERSRTINLMMEV